MYLRRSRGVKRVGFTLIELLVVIAIIAVLVGITAAGVMKIMWKIPEVQTRTDISQMDAALASFMADYNLSQPPPSVLVLREDMSYPAGDPSGAFLRKVFGKNLGSQGIIDWNGNGTPDGPHILEGEQCLVFYLGGIPSIATGVPQCQGFSTNNMNPSTPGGARKGPYFQFQTGRLILPTNPNAAAAPSPSFFMYIDGWKVDPVRQKPYAFFSSSGVNNSGYLQNGMNDCQSIGAKPYRDAGGNFTFGNKYQIISAGQDLTFGGGVWNPAAGASDAAGRDDQANFSSRVLAGGQQ